MNGLPRNHGFFDVPRTRVGKIRLACLVLILVGVAIFSKAQVLLYYGLYSPREGDIVFQSLPKGELVDAIEGVTESKFSHCGVVLRDGNRWVVVESILSVRKTPLLTWLQRGKNAGFAVYRLRPEFSMHISDFKANLIKFLDFPYDYSFEMSDHSIYCSELIYDAFEQTTAEKMGTLETLGDLNWQPYEENIRALAGNTLPLDRVMITPVSLSKATQIQPVFRMGF